MEDEKQTRNTQKARRIASLKKTRETTNGMEIRHSMVKGFGHFGGIFKTPKGKFKLKLFLQDSLGVKITSVDLMTPEAIQKALADSVEYFENPRPPNKATAGNGYAITQEQLEEIQDLLFAQLGRKLVKST